MSKHLFFLLTPSKRILKSTLLGFYQAPQLCYKAWRNFSINSSKTTQVATYRRNLLKTNKVLHSKSFFRPELPNLKSWVDFEADVKTKKHWDELTPEEKQAQTPEQRMQRRKGFLKLNAVSLPTEEPRHSRKVVKGKKPIYKRAAYFRLFKLFFFWFILLYKDLYYYLTKTAWNLWFNFLNISFVHVYYSKFFNNINLFYLHVNSLSLFNFYKLHANYKSINFINHFVSHRVSGNIALLFTGTRKESTKDISYINFSRKFTLNYTLIMLPKWKQNVALNRTFKYMV